MLLTGVQEQFSRCSVYEASTLQPSWYSAVCVSMPAAALDSHPELMWRMHVPRGRPSSSGCTRTLLRAFGKLSLGSVVTRPSRVQLLSMPHAHGINLRALCLLAESAHMGACNYCRSHPCRLSYLCIER